jgi:DNA-binding response OmpR family regulator
VLLIEPDARRAAALARDLGADGFEVAVARSAEHARSLARSQMPRVVLLGELEPPRGALALLDEIRGDVGQRSWDPSLGAIFLAGSRSHLETLRALEAGADHALPARAGYLELRASLRALMRRLDGGFPPTRVISVRALRIDTATHTVTLAGDAVPLRRLEFSLLAHLASDPERVFDRQALLAAVWGYRCAVTTRTVDSHASRLRIKLDARGAGRWVINVWGIGYRLI